jgi:hypothetical protein
MTDQERRQHIRERPARWQALPANERAALIVAANAPEIVRLASAVGEPPFVRALLEYARLCNDPTTATRDPPSSFEHEYLR